MAEIERRDRMDLTWVVFAQSSGGNAELSAMVRRIVRGGLGTSPTSAGTLFLTVLGWLAVLAVAMGLWQRDRKAWLRGLFDVRANLVQIGIGLEILRRNKRPLWVLMAAAVASWTGWSLRVWQQASSREELETLMAMHENSPVSFAASHAFAAALVPFRDLVSLGDLVPLVAGACVLLFSRTATLAAHVTSRTRPIEGFSLKRRLGSVWVGLLMLASYRVVAFLATPATAPMADCMYLNALLIPLLMVLADATLLSWVLTEYGRAILWHVEWKSDDTAAFLRSLPSAGLACVLINPGRYVLTAIAIWEAQFTGSFLNWPASRWVPIVWIATIGQVFGLAWCAIPAVLAVTRTGSPSQMFRNFAELTRCAGGQVLGLTAIALTCNFLVTLPFYWIFGIMQQETWSLVGAASYGHYATLLSGIVLLAGFTELAHQILGVEQDRGPVGALLSVRTSSAPELETTSVTAEFDPTSAG